jgi:hypothetical protein
MFREKNNMLKRLMVSALTLVVSAALLLAHGNATHVMGTVTANDGTHVTVKTQDGKSETVMLQKTTKYLTSSSKAAAASDVKVGIRVVIDANMDAKTKMLMADEVRVGVSTAAKTDGKAKAAADKHSDHK